MISGDCGVARKGCNKDGGAMRRGEEKGGKSGCDNGDIRHLKTFGGGTLICLTEQSKDLERPVGRCDIFPS